MSDEPTERPRSGRSLFLVGAALGMAVVLVGTVVVRVTSDDGSACEPVAAHPGWSVARRWDEATLDAIRRALPAPTVHARNLFHVSAAMWDAWAAHDPAVPAPTEPGHGDGRIREACRIDVPSMRGPHAARLERRVRPTVEVISA